jgi:hypothetical protein
VLVSVIVNDIKQTFTYLFWAIQTHNHVGHGTNYWNFSGEHYVSTEEGRFLYSYTVQERNQMSSETYVEYLNGLTKPADVLSLIRF